ncbi:MAG: SagB/ThcOx family dehydrogenase [Anaerolineales bacterium]|nr:MAG: SagB/ThcOx family dehydrogenase [Anaerolineales bacterium]
MEANRSFLKSDLWKEFDQLETDQRKQKPRPEVQKPYPDDAELIELVPFEDIRVGTAPLKEVIQRRKSQRFFTEEYLSLEELSFLLWATQGIRETSPDGVRFYRNVPSGGNRHSLETYLSIHRVESLDPGLYRYLPLEHKLLQVKQDKEIALKVSEALMDQEEMKDGKPYIFTRDCAVVFIWTTLPHRTEWRYSLLAHKMIAIDVGHVCQNLYLASVAINAGTCAIGALDRMKMDQVLGVDGEQEFTIYAATVGKVE